MGYLGYWLVTLLPFYAYRTRVGVDLRKNGLLYHNAVATLHRDSYLCLWGLGDTQVFVLADRVVTEEAWEGDLAGGSVLGLPHPRGYLLKQGELHLGDYQTSDLDCCSRLGARLMVSAT